jgi:simple sugar transport system permease protein
VISDVLSLAFLAQLVFLALPYAFAAMGGAITERAGVIDLALEAKLLFGAFAAAAVTLETGSPYLGILGAMAAGMAVTTVQLLCALRLRADQVIVGIALNVLALGGTRFLLQLLYQEGANSPKFAPFGKDVAMHPLVWLAVVSAVALPFAFRHTRWGLRLRAAGDRPDALVAVGVHPSHPRIYAALVGGALTGAGGAQLALAVGGFVADMSSGKGYIALAMVILAGWRPAFAALACAGLAAAEAVNIVLQINASGIPHEIAQTFPYVLTLVVLAIAGGKHGKPPRSLGKL